MSSTKRPQKNQGSNFSFEGNNISGSAFGDGSVVNNRHTDSSEIDEFLHALKDLQDELIRNSEGLSKEDFENVKSEIAVIKKQLSNPEKITSGTVLDALKEVNGILGKAGIAGVVLKQLFDIATILYGRN